MKQEKNLGGRPPKLRTQEEIDKLHGSAKDYAQRTRGQAVDKELEDTLLPVLREQTKNFVGLNGGGWSIPDWLETGKIIIRTEAWGKTAKDFGTEDDIDEEMHQPFEEKLYAELYIDALANEFATRAKQHHLTPELSQFAVRVLEAAFSHCRKLPAAVFHSKQQLAEYLAELKQNPDTYREPLKPKLRPGPKPRQVVLEHAGPEAYVVYESA